MSQSICQCHCGTRIDLDEQLLEERQMWKQKYLCLQKQVKIDIQTLKQNIYAQCASIMQAEFSQKEHQNNKVLNQKNVQIKDLIARVINLETQVKVLTKQKEISQQKLKQFQNHIDDRQQLINNLKSKSSKNIRDWELKHEQQLANLKQRLTTQAKESLDKVQAQRELLKQKLKEFQTKYQKLLPQIQKMRNCIAQKSTQNEELVSTIQKIKKSQQQSSQSHVTKYQSLQKIHSTCSKQISQLSQQNSNLLKQLDRCKKQTRQVKVEPVYIDRPVQVEKVVEKIVEVEKIVNKYIENPVYEKRVKVMEDDNRALKQQLNGVLREVKEMEESYQKNLGVLQETIKEHEKNVGLYKKEREALANKIGEQNKELEMLHHFIEKIGAQKTAKCQGDGQKIVVHVKQDGTYQKTVQRLPAPASSNNNRKKK